MSNQMKLLYITSLSGKRINSFMRSAIVAAKKCGIDFTMACNTDMADKEGYIEDCSKYGIKLVHIDFDRNPLSFKNIKAKKQLNNLMKRERYNIVHCNTPIGGLLGRLCAKKNKTPYVIYQAHGFHFWKGAPIKNWLLYYPVEKVLANYTDTLITINSEDYKNAMTFHLRNNGKIIKINGVGVAPYLISSSDEEKMRIKEDLGIANDTKVFISVGELNDNKNHILAINAFSKLNKSNWIYLICGQGENYKKLLDRINELGLSQKIKLLGFRSDVNQLLEISDVFVFPSKREGLSAALMEAMEVGLPCIAGNIRGNTDLLLNSELLFNPSDVNQLLLCIEKTFDNEIVSNETNKNKQNIKLFEFDRIVDSLSVLYADVAESIQV